MIDSPVSEREEGTRGGKRGTVRASFAVAEEGTE